MLESAFENIFELESEDLDAVRIEAQAISPQEQREIEELVLELHRRFLEQMGPFLAWDIDPGLMAKKFITTTRETLPDFNDTWMNAAGLMVASYALKEEVGAQAFRDDGNFVVGIPPELWRYISEEDWQGMLAAQQVTPEELKARLKRHERCQVILHEMTHLYQFTSALSPLWLQEAQAYWVAREFIIEPLTAAIADFFQSLLEKYGNEVHELIFGKSLNPILSTRLKQEFTPDIQKALFPNYTIQKIDAKVEE